MARRCELTGKGNQTGHKISHSNIKTKKVFKVNVQNVTLHSDVLNQDYTFNIAVTTLRSVDHNGGLDNFLTSTADSKLTPKAIRLKKQIKKKLEAKKKVA